MHFKNERGLGPEEYFQIRLETAQYPQEGMLRGSNSVSST